MKYSLRLQKCDFDIENIKGALNTADRLISYSEGIVMNINKYSNEKVLIMDADRIRILDEVHIKSSHGSTETMKFLMLDDYDWIKIKSEIEKLVSKCKICTRGKGKIINTKIKSIEMTEPN